MKVALYARVSTERRAERGTIGSQLAVLREHVTAAGHELRASTSTTGTLVRGWTGPDWTRCGMPPRLDCSRRSGACRRTG
jgi:hypothetical protein